MIPRMDALDEVSILHRVIRYMDNLGDDLPIGFSDCIFGLLGDVLPHQ